LSVFAGSLDWGHGLGAFAEIVEVLVGDHFGLDETPLEIAVNSSSSLRCWAAPWDGPASDLFLASYTYKSVSIAEFTKRAGKV